MTGFLAGLVIGIIIGAAGILVTQYMQKTGKI